MEIDEIIDRTYEGDVQAFSELVSRYRDMAFGYALTLVPREQTAEDVVQEAMVLAYQNLDHLRQPRAFGAWLKGIIRNQSYRALRAEPTTVSLDALDLPNDETDPTAHFDGLGQVREAIDALDTGSREIVLLHYERGLSQQEIAQKLSLSVGAVNMRLHSARSRLKRRLTFMTEITHSIDNPGRIQEVDGRYITMQFAPNATPPIFTKLSGQAGDTLCVVQHLSAGRVAAISSRPGSIWTPGQEVRDSGNHYSDAIDPQAIGQIVEAKAVARSGSPLVSGIKSIDMFAPLTQSGTLGIFAEWGLGVLVLLPELIHSLDKPNNRQSILAFVPPVENEQHWKDLNAEITLGSINVSIAYIPVADPIKLSFNDSVSNLDARIVLGRHLAEQAIWPCIDPLVCRSKRLDSSTESADHNDLVKQIGTLIRSYYSLQFSMGDADRHTLTPDELQTIQRARKAVRYLSQPFFVAEPYTNRPGVFVDPEDARKTFADILSGVHDGTHRDAFYMTGGTPVAKE